MILLFTSILLFFCRRILLSFVFSLGFSTLALNVVKSSILYGCVKRQPQDWWSSEVKVVSERRKDFASANRCDEERQACISGFRLNRQNLGNGMAGEMLVSLPPKSDPTLVYFILQSIAGSACSFSFTPNLLNCSCPEGRH